jgi:uncharacterized protein (TIGR03083 family)
MTLDFDRYVAVLEELVADTARLLDGVAPDTPVPGCDGWDAAELRDHTAGVLAFWIHQLTAADANPAAPGFPPEVRERYKLPLVQLGAEMRTAIVAAGPGRRCWNWSGSNLTSDWAARRMANEFGVHRCDAQATAGVTTSIPVDLAADGIDEAVEVFLRTPDGEPFDEAGVVRFETSNGDWNLAVGNGVRSGAGTPAAWVRGDVDQVLLHLWGRPSTAVETGDASLMKLWRQIEAFS